MNNSSSQQDNRLQSSSPPTTSPWMHWLASLPLNRKTNLISWCSFGGLVLVLSAGGLILYGTLKEQLSERTKSHLQLQSEMIEILNRGEVADRVALEQIAANLATEEGYSAIYLRQADDNLVLSSASKNLSLTDDRVLNLAIAQKGEIVKDVATISEDKYLLTAKTITDNDDEVVGVLVHGSSLETLYTPLRNGLLAQFTLSLIVLIAIAYLSRILRRAIAEPIQTLQKVAQDFSDGDLEARARVTTTDEVGLLGTTFNVLADSIAMNEARFTQGAERSRLLQEIVFNISQAEDVAEILQIAVASSKDLLQADRVIYYQFNENWQGKIIAEAVEEKFPQILGREIDDPCFAEGYADKYRQGQTKAVANVYEAGLGDCHLKMLEQFAVVASVVTPVVVKDRLTGLLIAHQCSQPRAWQQEEVDLLLQIASQVGRAVEKSELLQQQQRAQEQERAARENLQRRALELLMEVDPVSQGDLTVQVKVQEDEIGTIGDSYNATIESLRKLVAQVKIAALQVSTTTSEQDLSLKELSTGASAQTAEINAALTRIQGITNSIQAVANNAKAAETAMLKAAETVKAGDDAMNQTVAGFQEIRDTVAATAKKVKRLGESSQKISKVVNLIGNFADQTNLLALNASIEAAHAGEEGRGFAVVADEVRSLARQSATATAEIEALVAEIQAETNEVVAAMEAGTEQVVTGTKLVDKTRLSLIEIADVSQEIDRLVEEIAAATVEQSQDSELVSQTMMQVAQISNQTAAEAGEVSASFQDLLNVAQQLQDSVAKFKVS